MKAVRARAQQHVHRGNLLIVAIVVCALGPHVGLSARPPPATVPQHATDRSMCA